MNRRSYLVLLVSFFWGKLYAGRASDKSPISIVTPEGRPSSMLDESAIRDLFDRWERVWHQGQFDLVATCVAENYIRHDESGDRTVTRDAYAKEIAQIQAERPNIRVVVYDHTFKGDWAWFRFAFKWPDSKTGEPCSRAGMQSYRIEGGKLAETWLAMMPPASTWTDAIAQEHWMSPPPIK